MELKSLQDKRATMEASFNELDAEKQTHLKRVGEFDSELLKLQGEHRLVTDLIDNFKVKETKNAK